MATKVKCYKLKLVLLVLFFSLLYPLVSFSGQMVDSFPCMWRPMWQVPSYYDVIFYGGIEPDSYAYLQDHRQNHPPSKFHIVEAFKGISPFTKTIELSGVFIITNQDFLIGANYRDGGLLFLGNIAGTGCHPEKDILAYLRSPEYTFLNRYFLLICIVLLAGLIFYYWRQKLLHKDEPPTPKNPGELS